LLPRLTLGRLLVAGFLALCALDAPRPALTAVPAPAPPPTALPARSGAPNPGAIRLIPVGRYDFEAPPGGERALRPEGLSGLVSLGGDRYLAVGDEHACLHSLTIEVDSITGKIRAARFGEPIRLLDSLGAHLPDSALGKDREGIALDTAAQSVWIANERTGTDLHRPSLERYALPSGRMTALVRVDSDPMLRVFANIRVNLGFESLARGSGGFWTANEGPLTVDGASATNSVGAVVRLQKLDDAMRPVAQYPYEIDRYPARITSPFFLARNDVSGLSELLELDDGRLLTLERSFAGDSTGSANFRNRIYLVDVTDATDISRGELAAGLDGRAYTPARKTLLWEVNSGFTNSNFEGMALGGRLANGDRLLLLIADNDTGRSEALYSLRLVLPK
jgi:Esterase-like activity of phytase